MGRQRSPRDVPKLPSEVVYCGREVCGELGQVEQREFLVTNGKGGYASMTAACSLTRSYHGLLIAALRPPLDRTLLLSKLNETVRYLGKTYRLATERRSAASRYPGKNAEIAPRGLQLPGGDFVSPMGYLHLESVRLEGSVPVFTYALGGDALLEKRIWMAQGQNTVYVGYYLRRASEVVELDLAAWVNHRDHHSRTRHDSPGFSHAAVARGEDQVHVSFGSSTQNTRTELRMRLEHGRARIQNAWIPDLILDRERLRGLPAVDAALHAASFSVELVPGARATFIATAEPDVDLDVDGEEELAAQHMHAAELIENFENATKRAKARRRSIAKRLHRSVPVVEQWPRTRAREFSYRESNLEDSIRQLVLAADQYIIKRANGHSLVAGWHWFTDWARDTMISLPGLTIVTGRFELARSILVTFARYVSRGMLPNRFPDDGTAPKDEDYNNADGTLWYFESIRAYYAATGDLSILEQLFAPLEAIILHHVAGTRFGIKQDKDGLLWAGAPDVALSWMDAKCGRVMTPRRGKPVEVQALWFNALNSMAFFAAELGRPQKSATYTKMADKTERGFRRKMWCSKRGHCYDVIGKDGDVDETLRPNQLIAAALNFSPLNAEQRYAVVEACSVQLLTAHGLRTLPESDPRYRGVYEGNMATRDAAYHQGTAWAWLLGPFVIAHLRVFGDKRKSRAYLKPLLRSHLSTAGLGQVSEIFDADAPFRPRGCVAQAWSVAEVLRAWAATELDDGE